MRGLLTAVLLACATAVAAGEPVYRYVDPSGVVHYTDRAPDRHAKPIRIVPASGSARAAPKTFYSPEALRQAARFAVRIESPTPEQRVAGSAPIIAAASVMPALVNGFHLVYQLDGSAATAAPIDQLSVPLGAVAAGEHELVVVLLDEHGREIARSEPSRFTVAPIKLAQQAPKKG